ncbi:hypothetical protein [Vreelandella neptunia]|uniref:Uncharacterized protein n=1 Tax=Vreelandella neptunia TaxID=115551 RepID=A0ABS9S1P3_9GAMM|nr:hypothetical protein [Halomonas neptunia]MCH4810005.1 hypothetical protein [Halomonas neptunia]
MKTLCISGAQSIEFDYISALLFGAGIKQAKPVERAATIGMAEWHHNTLSALKQKKTPGRLWEQLAGDLILANLDDPQWGWADTKVLEALDFWAQLEPNIYFLLLTSDPQDYLAQRLLNDADEEGKDEQAYLQEWQTLHEQLLDFYLENADRCLLVNAVQAAANPKALTQKLEEQWHFQLDNSKLSNFSGNAAHSAPTSLASYISNRVIREHSKSVYPLKDELLAAQQPLTDLEGNEGIGKSLKATPVSLPTLLRDYKRLCEEELTDNERQALQDLKKENAKLLNELQQSNQNHIKAKKNEKKKENELLLFQLHQVQEELEHYFLQHQQKKEEAELLKKENRELKQQYMLAREQTSAPQGLFSRKRKKITPVLKFEGVQLRHEQVNSDYEHLWISLQSPIFGKSQAEKWDFRISCAGVKPGEFGKQPKLELPEQNDQLFTNWFAESESEHGRKLELRFALPNAMDTGVWKQISSNDQQLIKSLLEQLPEIISDLKNKKNYIHRNWSDWEALVANMQRISKEKTSK